MTRRMCLPPCRKFPPRLSEEELKERVTTTMNEKGANFHYQACLYSEAAKEVVGSENHSFVTLQPKAKQREDQSWIRAYEFVYAFLKKHEMDLSQETMKTEFAATGEPTLSDDLGDVDNTATELLDTAERMREVKVSDLVEQFAEELQIE